jgi:hypothetical protein
VNAHLKRKATRKRDFSERRQELIILVCSHRID